VKHWQWVIDVLIMTNGDDYRVSQTCPIPLNEADTNESAKKTAKDISAVAEKYSLLAAENCGNRLFRSAIHVAANKNFVYDISRQMKQPLTVC